MIKLSFKGIHSDFISGHQKVNKLDRNLAHCPEKCFQKKTSSLHKQGCMRVSLSCYLLKQVIIFLP